MGCIWPMDLACGRGQSDRGTTVFTIKLDSRLGMEQLETELPLRPAVADVHPDVPGHFRSGRAHEDVS